MASVWVPWDVLDEGFDLLENGILATVASPPLEATSSQ